MNYLTRKILIVFCLISLIPLLVFAYLILPHFLTTATYIRYIPAIVFITGIIVMLGLFLLMGISKNIARLSAGANIIAKGDLTHCLQVKDDGQIVELANSVNQITQRLREDVNDLEARAILIDRANKELNRLNRLKSEFVSMVSHELRAPLINIKQTTSLLLNKLTGHIDEETERCLEIVSRNTQRLLRLISDLLDISRIEAGELRLNPEMISIEKIIQEATESLERWRVSRRIRLKIEIQPNLPNIYADSDRINQILINLLSNAIKFTPSEGEITIKAGMEKKGDFLEVSVADTGAGIAQEEIDKIFNRFKQAGEASVEQLQGIGLGLSITREIVKMHGGNIWVESKKGQGSKFTFTLPKYCKEEILKAGTESRFALETEGALEVSPEGGRVKKYIMIVDDESVVVETLKELLVKIGYRDFFEANNGEEALKKLNIIIPDLIILDMRMPKITGYEVIRRLKEDTKTKEIPILIISAYEVDMDRLREYTGKTIPIMAKPFDTDRLRSLINQLL